MKAPLWIWQLPSWTEFHWQAAELAPLLRACWVAQGRLQGMLRALSTAAEGQSKLDAQVENIVASAAIEGVQLHHGSVRASLAHRQGLLDTGPTTTRSEGLAKLLLDASLLHQQPLGMQRLLTWHGWVFPGSDLQQAYPQRIGELRGTGPMQVISGRPDRPTVHFEAPPRDSLEELLTDFLGWFETSTRDPSLDPFLRAGIAHLWFVTLHPFEDGNGRLTRAITDQALAQADPVASHFVAIPASILEDRAGYYRQLELSQRGTPDITAWLHWFLVTLLRSQQHAISRIDRQLVKARFWLNRGGQELTAEQIAVINRLLDGGAHGFESGISAAQYQALAMVSKATATRHLAELVAKGCLRKLPGGGRSTRYLIHHLDDAQD